MTTDSKRVEESKTSVEDTDQHSIGPGETENIINDADLPPLLRGLSPEELRACEQGLLRKLDARLMPTMILIYIMNYLDRFVTSVRTSTTRNLTSTLFKSYNG